MAIAPIAPVRILVSLVCICILLAFMHAASSILTPLLLALTVSVAFQPVAERITRRGWPPIVNALLVCIGVLAMVGGAAVLVYLAVDDLTESLPRYSERMRELQQQVAAWLHDHGMRDSARAVRRYDLARPVEGMLQSWLLGAGASLPTLFLVLIITAFIQVEGRVYRRKLIRAFGRSEPVREVMDGLREVQRFLLVKLTMSLANGVFLGLWCWMWGIDSPLLWGVVAFVLNFIPVIGSILAAIPPILLGLITGGPFTMCGVAVGYGLVNLLVDNIAEPRIMGRTLGLSPLVILLAMLVWGFVLGPVGALLAVPLTMSVKIMFEQDDDLRRVALIMSDGSHLAERSRDPGPGVAASSTP